MEGGQNLRLYHLARHLAPRHELTLIAFGESVYPAPLKELFRDIHTLPVEPAPRPRRGLGRIVDAFDPGQLVHRSVAMARLIRDVSRQLRPDAVWIGGWDMLVYADELEATRVVADPMDEGCLEQCRNLAHARGPATAFRAVKDLLVNIRWERRYFRRADHCLFVSAVDARWARGVVPGLGVSVVENGVDADFFRPQGAPEDPATLVFEGNQGFPPNVDAARYFAREIFPLVRQSVPECRFLVVGRDPSASTRALVGDHVDVTGRVEDIRPFLDRATVFVCPMRMGAGIKNKILQAWAMEKPVVATSTAIGGLRATPGENIVVATGAKAFAEAVVALLRNSSARQHLGKHGRDTVLTFYSWEQQARTFENVLGSA